MTMALFPLGSLELYYNVLRITMSFCLLGWYLNVRCPCYNLHLSSFNADRVEPIDHWFSSACCLVTDGKSRNYWSMCSLRISLFALSRCRRFVHRYRSGPMVCSGRSSFQLLAEVVNHGERGSTARSHSSKRERRQTISEFWRATCGRGTCHRLIPRCYLRTVSSHKHKSRKIRQLTGSKSIPQPIVYRSRISKHLVYIEVSILWSLGTWVVNNVHSINTRLFLLI